jgi:hypothetical protein
MDCCSVLWDAARPVVDIDRGRRRYTNWRILCWKHWSHSSPVNRMALRFLDATCDMSHTNDEKKHSANWNANALIRLIYTLIINLSTVLVGMVIKSRFTCVTEIKVFIINKMIRRISSGRRPFLFWFIADHNWNHSQLLTAQLADQWKYQNCSNLEQGKCALNIVHVVFKWFFVRFADCLETGKMHNDADFVLKRQQTWKHATV